VETQAGKRVMVLAVMTLVERKVMVPVEKRVMVLMAGNLLIGKSNTAKNTPLNPRE